LLNFSFETYFR